MSTRSELKQASYTYEGRRYYTYGRTYEEAREKAAIKRALMMAGLPQGRPACSVEKWASEWLRIYKADASPQWQRANKRIIEAYILPHIGTMNISDVKPKDIALILNGLTDCSESYAHKVLNTLKQIFRTALDNDLIDKDPTRSAKLPQCRPNTSHRTITPYERELTVRAANKNPKDGLFVLLMLYCGLRPQEAAALRGKDIDLKKRVLHVSRARKSNGELGATKSVAGMRDVPIPIGLIRYIPELAPNECACKNTLGEPLNREAYQRLWRRFKKAMELEHGTKTYRNKLVEPFLPEDLTLYCYRHTYCTDLQDAGVPLAVASRLMGHSDISLTAKIYTHASEDSFADAMRKIDAHMGTTAGTTQGTTSGAEKDVFLYTEKQ